MYTPQLTNQNSLTITMYIEYNLGGGQITVNVVNSAHHVKQQILKNEFNEEQQRTITNILIEQSDMVS